jgi:hypothetical protein
MLYVQTKNRRYCIQCLGGTAIRIAGHPKYCPTPAVGRVFELGLVERGRPLPQAKGPANESRSPGGDLARSRYIAHRSFAKPLA